MGQRYELVDVVGRGGQGTVYKAFDRWSERSVAVKVLGSKAVQEPQMVERLMREQQALSALRGTAAVELFDLCRGNDGELCLVMELLSGVDLDDELYSLQQRGERMRLERVAAIFDPIVTTLEVAHGEGILHRDLKPGNIFLLEGGGVRLLDFGMARLKRAAPLTAAGMVMGSPSFMAPESWQGMSDFLDARADVYSLGVILFLVLAGELPLSGGSLQEKFLGATRGTHKSLRQLRPDLPRRADDWAARALALDRAQRFGSVRELWENFLTTFRVRPPNRRPFASLWAKAKGAVQRMGGGREPAPAESKLAPSVPWTREGPPSLVREALAQTMLVREPSSDVKPQPTNEPEETLDMDAGDLVAAQGSQDAAHPERAVEETVSISAELIVEPGADGPLPGPRRPIKK